MRGTTGFSRARAAAAPLAARVCAAITVAAVGSAVTLFALPAAASAQAARNLQVKLIWEFDHNGIFHLVQTLGVILFGIGLFARMGGLDLIAQVEMQFSGGGVADDRLEGIGHVENEMSLPPGNIISFYSLHFGPFQLVPAGDAALADF